MMLFLSSSIYTTEKQITHPETTTTPVTKAFTQVQDPFVNTRLEYQSLNVMINVMFCQLTINCLFYFMDD